MGVFGDDVLVEVADGFFGGGGGEADDEGVEGVEDLPPLVVDAAVAFVDDDEELFFVLRGEVTVELEGKRTVLKAGDTLHFDSSRQHSTWNHTNKAVSILWCGTMDVFGEEAINPIHRELNIAN